MLVLGFLAGGLTNWLIAYSVHLLKIKRTRELAEKGYSQVWVKEPEPKLFRKGVDVWQR